MGVEHQGALVHFFSLLERRMTGYGSLLSWSMSELASSSSRHEKVWWGSQLELGRITVSLYDLRGHCGVKAWEDAFCFFVL